MVVVPTLLSDENRVAELLKNLEDHYLANKEENLYFALIGGFKDSRTESSLVDNPILLKAQEGLDELNRRYAVDGIDIFYFFHRKNIFNEADRNWTGWERKRGALMEFNDLLLGAKDTSFIYHKNHQLTLAHIKYIITLDSDTVLPLGMAKKMIGTMAHPHNLPVIDPKRKVVIEGHGLMQPRISFDMDSSNKSLFSRIYTGQEGMDPYANAISDVYQDLFGEGIFTGKGIYDLKVFRDVLQNVVPENAVLSHDLLEGSYVRAALVSDLELVDSYPTKYNAYMARLHRWIRGDWQLIPWLSRTIYNKKKELISNPLSYISMWKITDNLRRSLLAPSLILLIVSAISFLPGKASFWLGCVALVITLPLLISTVEQMARNGFKLRSSKHHISGFFGFKASFFQLLLTTVFLSYQAIMVMNAIMVTLVRVLITKKKMLEWVTSADEEKGQSNSLMSYVFAMRFSSLLGIPLVVLAFLFKPENTLISMIFAVIWGIAPFVAYYISKGKDVPKEVLTINELKELRQVARKTWRYFEEFANKKNNYLAPDNYQEEPYRGLAFRTSPTNIGLGLMATITARDLGYICLEEMLVQLEKTVSSMGKMDHWNGHLYNWYDTRTLKPLRPRYISTVDSGNLVCYLMTLRQGLFEYFQRPLLDTDFIKGIEDTYACGNNQSLSFFEAEDLGVDKVNTDQSSVLTLKKILEQVRSNPKIMEMKQEAWKHKLKHMIQKQIEEVQEFIPWNEQLIHIPECLYSEALSMNGVELVALLDQVPSLKNYINHCKGIKEKIELLMNLPEFNQDENFLELDNWLKEVRVLVEEGERQVKEFILRYEGMIDRINLMSENTLFAPLYEKKRQLFSVGFNIEDNRLSNSYYDLLASEARQTSYIAIARSEVPPKHWYMLGRSLTIVDRYKGLVSWSGTMFEYLMPLILMKNYKNTLLDETYSFVIKSQQKYGKERNMPWGASESAFGSMDIHLDYKYKAIGVPWLGLKRGLIEDAVTAPYATFLALLVRPLDAYKNIQYLKKEGLEGAYGYYEAADYTPERLIDGQEKIIIKSYMAHHQGMSLLSLNNYLNKNVMQKRFSSDPYVKAARLLLQEKVPTNIVFTKENKEKIIPFKGNIYHDKVSYRHFSKPNVDLPKVHVLSNGYYSVITTDKGTGYSRTKDYAITRWREDSILDHYGMFFYIKNKETNENWSAAYAPMNQLPTGYEVVFTSDKTVYKRIDGTIETLTEIIVTSGENAEIRRIKLKNNGEDICDLEVTSYNEMVMTEQKSDEAHAAFSNLFVETEYNHEFKALLAHRRPRSDSDKERWVAHMAIIDGDSVGPIQYETDRMQFIGRGRTVSNPVVIEGERPLSNSTGNVLDPIFSLRVKVKLLPGKSARISFVTLVANNKEELLERLSKFNSVENCDAAFWLAVIRSQVEAKYLNIKAHEMELYQDMMSDILFLSPLHQKQASYIEQNRKSQSALWSYGVSGEHPIVVVTIQKLEGVSILYELLKAHEYWKIKDLRVDLIILVLEEYSYSNPIFALVTDIVESNQATNMSQKKGDVFILNLAMISELDVNLFTAVARLCFYGHKGSIVEQLNHLQVKELEPVLIPDYSIVESNMVLEAEHFSDLKMAMSECEKLQFFNGIGGFDSDYQRYLICLDKEQTTPVPWSNIIANETFGFLTTESGGGYTWCYNSRENKLTPWSNDPVCDTPSEIFYISDEAVNIWSMTPLPIREKSPYVVEHGFGYTGYKHVSHGIAQSLTQFVPIKGNIKISIISLKNEGSKERHLALTYYIKPVLGVSSCDTAMHLVTAMSDEGQLTVRNGFNQTFEHQVLYMDASITEKTYSGNRKAFFGQGSTKLPEELTRIQLSNQVGAGYDPCAAIQVKVSIKPKETIQLVFVMGIADCQENIQTDIKPFKTIEGALTALEDVKLFWKDKLNIVQVVTPDIAMNQMLNGHLLYQVIACRLWARTAFYQAGGAYGFRDQLQDTLSILSVWPELAKMQIIKHAGHQFVEGDVLHWWHEPALKGTRTRISDDFLWLPYVVSEYMSVTGDYDILDEDIQFLDSDLLKEDEVERYISPNIAEEKGSLYIHCTRAIENGFRFGEHGLPLMGCGDWNDGMNLVGNEGKGESVWLAWFLLTILKQWIPICIKHNDSERSSRYKHVYDDLTAAVEAHGWDGNWYKRAYFDDGAQLGSSNNDECKIDSLAQTWAVISGAGNPKRALDAMSALEDYLVSKNDGIIRLLTPPFDKGELEPGYIKGYVPGVRENGGQYTHAAAWVIDAFAKLGQGDKAFELFEMVNPINHARTNIERGIYKIEPYVMAADVYGCQPHIGRGGWSWYTGAAGWMYQVGLNSILGFTKKGSDLIIDPCIPKRWHQFSIQYIFEETTYILEVINPENISQGKVSLTMDGIELKDHILHMVGGQGVQNVQIVMHR
jgi:cellobiose phosphorylase